MADRHVDDECRAAAVDVSEDEVRASGDAAFVCRDEVLGLYDRVLEVRDSRRICVEVADVRCVSQAKLLSVVYK